jgi:serine/threonine-protein kinase
MGRKPVTFDPEADPTLPGGDRPSADRERASTGRMTKRYQRGGPLDGRYQLMDLLSEGGMAQVFRARHRELGRFVAIKMLHERYRQDLEMRQRMLSEAQTASALQHPHIAQVIDSGVDEQLGRYIVMDLLEGETLRQRLRRHAPSLRVAADVVDQVTDAVRYIHAHQIIHCDIKPENTFLCHLQSARTTHNHVRLIDFGLSVRTTGLLPDQFGGTVPYVAPERLEATEPSAQWDVFSLGVLLYEAVTRRPPFEGAPQEVLARQARGERPPPPSEILDVADERLDRLVTRAMAANPERRHPSAEAFHFELRAWRKMRELG